MYTHTAPSLLEGKSPCLVCDILPPEQQTFQSTTGRCIFFLWLEIRLKRH
jgi:hypothetical protein